MSNHRLEPAEELLEPDGKIQTSITRDKREIGEEKGGIVPSDKQVTVTRRSRKIGNEIIPDPGMWEIAWFQIISMEYEYPWILWIGKR